MRALKVLGLLVVAALTALLSGGPAGAGRTTAAVVAVAADVFPEPPRSAPAAAAPAPPTTAPPSTAVRAAPTTTPRATTTTTTTTTPASPTPSPTARTAEAERPALARAAGTPCRASARACVDLSGNRAWLISGGEAVYGPVPITHGRTGYRTPPGTFAVSFKNRDHVSSIYDAPMPYSVFFNGGIAFHQGSLRQQSHGCIHLSRTAAKRFFAGLDRGDLVQVVR